MCLVGLLLRELDLGLEMLISGRGLRQNRHGLGVADCLLGARHCLAVAERCVVQVEKTSKE